MGKWTKTLGWVPALVYALLWNLAQVSPGDARRNLKAWSPDWLVSRWALAAALGLTAIAYLWSFRTAITQAWRFLADLRLRSPIVAQSSLPPTSTRRRRLTPEERDAIQHARVEWTDSAALACDDLVLLLQRATEELGAAGNPLAPLLGQPTERLREGAKLFREAVAAKQPQLAEVHQSLVALRDAYMTGLFYLQRFVFADPAFPADKHYHSVLDRWRQAHPALAQVYSKLSKHSDYEGVITPIEADPDAISFIHNHAFRENVRNARARIVFQRLNLVTDNEQQFLNLFINEAPPAMARERQDTWMSNAVYRAGEELVRGQVLDRGKVREGVERFCLTESARQILAHREEGYKRHCVEIDGQAVFGTGASGSGASSSAGFIPPHIRPSGPRT